MIERREETWGQREDRLRAAATDDPYNDEGLDDGPRDSSDEQEWVYPTAESDQTAPGGFVPHERGWSAWLDDAPPSGDPPTLIDRTTSTPRPVRFTRLADIAAEREPIGRPLPITIAVVIALVVVAAVVIAIAVPGGEDNSHASGAELSAMPLTSIVPATPTQTTPEWAIEGCPRVRGSKLSSGADIGGTRTPQDAIFAFQYGYYVSRSGEEVRKVVADEANVPDAHEIQAGIDSVPRGTRYCLQILATDKPDVWRIELREQWPGKPAEPLAPALARTTSHDGQTMISAMTPA